MLNSIKNTQFTNLLVKFIFRDSRGFAAVSFNLPLRYHGELDNWIMEDSGLIFLLPFYGFNATIKPKHYISVERHHNTHFHRCVSL